MRCKRKYSYISSQIPASEAIALAQAGYGIAILPGFCLPPDGLPGLTVMPVQAGKEIDYGFVYAKRTPHIKLFEAEYTAHQAP